jgi:uncharacterized protein with FMN-binding domain
MSTGSTRRVSARRMAVAIALAPPVITGAASCSHFRHHPDRHDGGDASRPTHAPGPPTTILPGTTTLMPSPPTTEPVVTTTESTLPPVTMAPPTTVPPTTAPPVTAPPTTAAPSPKTVTGPVVSHLYGPVQVTVTVTGNRITAVTATGPNENPVSTLINNDAIPKLNAKVMAAQSANITGVSGATLTSPAYKKSLQAALDQAGFKG